MENPYFRSTFRSTFLRAMKVSFIAVHRNRLTSPIRAKITYKGVSYIYNTGESFSTLNFQKGKCQGKTPEAEAVNLKLMQIETAMRNAILYYSRLFEIPTQNQFLEKTDQYLKGSSSVQIGRQDKLFLPYVRLYIDGCGMSKDTIRTYNLFYSVMTKFQKGKKPFTFDDINKNFYDRLKRWMEQNDMSRNYIGSIVKNLKKFMGDAAEEGKHTNYAFKTFKKDREEADTISLNMDELINIHRLEFSDELLNEFYPDRIPYDWQKQKIIQSLDKYRKKFLIGAMCAMRVSDYGRIKKINIKNDTLTIMPKKGSGLKKPEPVSMPLHWIVKEIIESGFDFSEKTVEQTLNSQIKTICQMVRINEPVVTYITKGGKLKEMVNKKWELVSSHTARRSGATNMHLAGMPDHLIMACTGHTSEKQLHAYIKAQRMEKVEELRKSKYFKKK